MIRLKNGEETIRLSHEDIRALNRKEAEHIGARLRQIRRANALDVRGFSRVIHEESLFIHRYEQGEDTPHDEFLRSVCEKTGARFEWLADGTGDMFSDAPDVWTQEPGDVVQALARQMDEMAEALEIGNWSDDVRSANEYVRESEENLENYLAGRGMLDEIEDMIAELQSASEFRGYENGMRYGARLVFQLLTGENSRGLETLIQDVSKRLREFGQTQRGSETAP